MQNYLVTGGAGFIGSHLIEYLLKDPNHQVICIDNFDDYYDIRIKTDNISKFIKKPNFRLIQIDIRNFEQIEKEIPDHIDCIFHLAARAGVRPSIENPIIYNEVNILGTQNLLEIAKKRGVKQFVFASSSSVYGINPKFPWHESDTDLKPISPYASSKIAAELLGHVYSSLYDIRFIGLRFFTVYGPRQRPDLVIHKFMRKIKQGEEIDIYGDGSTSRDYTYVTDIVDALCLAEKYTQSSYEIINIGNNCGISLERLVSEIESILGIKAKKRFIDEMPGDVPITLASIDKAKKILGYQPKIDITEGLTLFKNWMEKELLL